MKPLISELSYGFALTHELVAGVMGQLRGSPIFPSLIQEGRSGGGYDLELPIIGSPLFLQFKLSDKMIKSTAAEWEYFYSPYYRMHLRSRRYSRQHSLLIELEETGNEVFYVAPYFHTTEELNQNFLAREVATNSIWIKPSIIGEFPDLDNHYVSFNRTDAYICSHNPKRLKRTSDILDVSKQLTNNWDKNEKQIDVDFFLNIINEIDPKETFKRPSEQMYKSKELLVEYALLAAFLSRSVLGTELIIISY